MTRALIRRLLVVAGRLPRFVPIGDRDPQQRIRVTLDGLGAPIDVTRNHVVASLRPLTIALALPATLGPETFGRRELRLKFSPQSDPDTMLGDVGLRHEGTITVDHTAFQLFRRKDQTDLRMPWGAATVFAFHHAWSEWTRRHRSTFRMEPLDLKAFQVLYVCPRPVVLVTVRHGQTSNLFPMDLIGPTDSPYFLMALRNTSLSVRQMTASRRMALADVPLEDTAIAYQLGEYHQRECIDWSALPFESEPSPAHGLPVPSAALRVRDVEVREARVVGSHTLFITEVIHEERRKDGLQMFHVSGPYYRYLVRHGVRPPRPVLP